METIPQRKSETRTGPHGPQELSYFHDNKGTKRRTSKMEDTPQSIQLPNWVPTREGRRETRRSDQKSRRPTNSRRKVTYKKLQRIAPKRMLGHTRGRRYQNRGNRVSRILEQGLRSNTTSIQQGRQDLNYQRQLDKRSQRDERGSTGAMPMEGRYL